MDPQVSAERCSHVNSHQVTGLNIKGYERDLTHSIKKKTHLLTKEKRYTEALPLGFITQCID